MDKRSEVNAVYNSIKACPHCNALGACIYYGLRAYMDKVGLDEFTRQLIMGILPSDIGHSYEMKLEILNRPNWFSNLLQHPLLLVKQGMLIVLDNKVLRFPTVIFDCYVGSGSYFWIPAIIYTLFVIFLPRLVDFFYFLVELFLGYHFYPH